MSGSFLKNPHYLGTFIPTPLTNGGVGGMPYMPPVDPPTRILRGFGRDRFGQAKFTKGIVKQ